MLRPISRLLLLTVTLLTCTGLFAGPSEEQYNSIIELAAEGKLDAAQSKLKAYLEFYPEDADLQAMAKQLESLSSKNESGLIEHVDKVAEPEMVPEEKETASGSGLSSEDRLEIETVIAVADKVQQLQSESLRREKAIGLLQREVPAAARESMAQEWLAYWLARAMMAIELQDVLAGTEAAQLAKRLGVLESENASAREIRVLLNGLGWFDKEISRTPKEGEDFTIHLPGGEAIELVWFDFEAVGGRKYGWVGKYEVTNGQFRAFDPEYKLDPIDGYEINGNRQPAIVTYHLATAFCEWLKEYVDGEFLYKFHLGLPSKDDWKALNLMGNREFWKMQKEVSTNTGMSRKEKAYQAWFDYWRKTQWTWGNAWPPPYGNFGDESLGKAYSLDKYWHIEEYNDGFVYTAPVEESGRNDFGLYGYSGNVWEWTSERVTKEWKDGKYMAVSEEKYVVLGGSYQTSGSRNPYPDLDANSNAFPQPESFISPGGAVGFRVFLLPKAE